MCVHKFFEKKIISQLYDLSQKNIRNISRKILASQLINKENQRDDVKLF